MIPRLPAQVREVAEGVSLAAPVGEVAIHAQRLLQPVGRAWVIPRPQPDDAEAAEGAGLAEPVAEVVVDAQGLLQVWAAAG